MKWMITRVERKFTMIEAATEAQALALCEAGLIPEEAWLEDDRPYEYSNDLGEPYEEDGP